jgi:hypothetical protein
MKYAVDMDAGAMVYTRIYKFRKGYFIHSKVGERGTHIHRCTDLQVNMEIA